MIYFVRFIWVLAVLASLSSVIWFILGATANFKRDLDVVSSVILFYFGVPSILLIIISLILLLKRWTPTSTWGIVGISVIILCMLVLSPVLFKNVNKSGWLSESIVTDTLQVTANGQLEYQLELVNLFQKNSLARLYVRRKSNDEEIRIPLEISLDKIKGLTEEKMNYWITLEQTLDTEKYILYTTSKFPLPNRKFEVYIGKKEAVEIQ